MQSKTVGILGGMGPAATAHFFERLIALTPAQKDQDHIPVIIYNNPGVPDRTESILGHGESCVPELQKGVSVLENAGADFIVMPCNTAHHYYDGLVSHAKVPIVNLIEEVVNAVLDVQQNLQTIGLLATKGTLVSNLYQDAFRKKNIDVLVPEEWETNDFQAVINRIKSGQRQSLPTQTFAENLVQRGAQGIVLACTELSLVKSEFKLSAPIFDSTEILANKAVRLALR